MAETPLYPAIHVSVSNDDPQSFESRTTLLTVRTRVPNELMERTDWVGDLFKEMFDGRP